MTESSSPPQKPVDVGPAVIRRRSRFSVVWLIPMTAAAIGGWLWYRSIVEAGLPITLHFADGAGIHEGKTHIRHEGVSIGTVESIELSEDFEGVVVKAELEKSAAGIATEGAVFWLVKPRVDFGGVSGLETLVSGAYIAVRPGHGKRKTKFTALPKPPTIDPSEPGLHIVLTSKTLGTLMPGTPVYFRKMQVGSMQEHTLAEDHRAVRIRAHIEKQYASLVGSNTRFWNASGISVQATLSGVKVHTESLAAILVGGVAFDTPEGQAIGKPSQNGDEFRLHPDHDRAMEAGLPVTITFSSGNGLHPGTPLKHRGLVIGKTKSVELSQDGTGVVVQALLNESARDVAREGSQFWVVKARLEFDTVTGLDTLVSGKYIGVRPGQGPTRTAFVGLDEPPRRDPASPGLHLVLEADSLGSLGVGAPIYYRRIRVGEVDGYDLIETEGKVKIRLFVEEEYAHLVRGGSCFYNVSGLTVEASLSGVKVRTESLTALVGGGVAFVTPEGASAGEPSQDGDVFQLYRDRKSATERGLPITIQFSGSTSLRKGAAIKYRGMKVGEVKSVKLNREMTGVSVAALLDGAAADLARAGSLFWVVRPTVDLSGVSGLETLVAGQYIQVRPGKGERETTFTGLLAPPLRDRESPGLHIALLADRLGSLRAGAPVYFRNLQVGEVQGHNLVDRDHRVKIHLCLEEQHAHLVKKSSCFYNASGISVTASVAGVKIKTESLMSMLGGGVAFITPETAAAPSVDGDTFKLYPDIASAQESAEDKGLQITIAFRTAQGIREGETQVRYLGMVVGRVTTVSLKSDLSGVTVGARLHASASDLAREGARYWLVKPEVGIQGVRGLETLVRGAYIEARPGTGGAKDSFVALDRAPRAAAPDVTGLHVILEAERLGSLKPGSPVYYREIKVGQIDGHELAPTADRVFAHATIHERYAPLVRENTVFWNASGIGVDIGFSGFQIQTESLEALLQGGIAFATPGGKTGWFSGAAAELAPPAKDGATFMLHAKLDKKWLKWNPRIPLGEAGAQE